MVKIFVGGFPLEMEEMDLVRLVSPYGEVSTIKIVRDKATRICKGYAFLEITNEEGALAAIAALDGMQLGKRQLSVNLAEPPQTTPPRYEKARGSVMPVKKKRPRI